MSLCICMYVSECMSVRVYTGMCLCEYVCDVCIFVCPSVCVCVHVGVCVCCVCVCVRGREGGRAEAGLGGGCGYEPSDEVEQEEKAGIHPRRQRGTAQNRLDLTEHCPTALGAGAGRGSRGGGSGGLAASLPLRQPDPGCPICLKVPCPTVPTSWKPSLPAPPTGLSPWPTFDAHVRSPPSTYKGIGEAGNPGIQEERVPETLIHTPPFQVPTARD